MNIPFIDLRAQYELIRTRLDQRFKDAFSAFQFCRGPEVQQFEESFARAIQVKHCIWCGNGTDALFLALKAFHKALVNLAPYQEANCEGDFPVSGKLENDVLSLPVYPELQPEAIAFVAGKIKAFYNS